MPPHALVDEVEVLDVEARERLAPRAEGGARVREQVQPRVVAGEGDAKAHPSGGDVDDVILAQRRAAAETVPDVGEGRKAAGEESLSLCCVVVGGSATNRNRSPNEGPSRARRSPKTLMGGGGGGDAEVDGPSSAPRVPDPAAGGVPTARAGPAKSNRAPSMTRTTALFTGARDQHPGNPGAGDAASASSAAA